MINVGYCLVSRPWYLGIHVSSQTKVLLEQRSSDHLNSKIRRTLTYSAPVHKGASPVRGADGRK